ncbi:hypothetical protein [Photobacterium frigidiphilum]|uniref:hypothetical protein n=1 Tax=Photobacterium frigidiphilum TaxID=264736 RepID=UPI001473B744|nr:hypothetical protein [Photobacterium frigidiphilum]
MLPLAEEQTIKIWAKMEVVHIFIHPDRSITLMPISQYHSWRSPNNIDADHFG